MNAQMDTKELTESLTVIFDCRLKALIGYQSTEFTRELISYMFGHFDYLRKHTSNDGYRTLQNQYLSNILSYKPGSGPYLEVMASSSAKELALLLENYIRNTIAVLYPDWQTRHDPKDWRKVLGREFEKEMHENPERFPAGLRNVNFFSQLNYTAIYRNKQAHRERFGNTGLYPRYYILKAYDVILCYLIYTFYHLCLNKDYEPINLKKKDE